MDDFEVLPVAPLLLVSLLFCIPLTLCCSCEAFMAKNIIGFFFDPI
jgi:hypothetical protein